MLVESAAPFEAVFATGISGQAGVVEVAVIDNDGNVVIGPTSNDITEAVIGGVPSGLYTWNCPAAPAALGQYTIAWSIDGLWNPENLSTADELIVVSAGATDEGGAIPVPAGGGIPFGPAQAWTTVDDVALCCSPAVGTDYSVYQDSVDEASQLLFELSGRLYAGLMSKTVRPFCRCSCTRCQVLSRGHIVGDVGHCCEDLCSPGRILLSGYPVREITEVKIDGVVLADTEYRLDNYRWAVRKNGYVWPYYQNFTVDDTETGTWSISYTYGQPPPLAGQAAAAELACEAYKACYGGSGIDCALPTGVSRVSRQGIVIEKLTFTAWGLQGGIWRTGLPRVDAFLNAYNPNNLQRRPTAWSPASHMQYARRVG